VKRDEPITLSLGGRSWLVKHVDWNRRQVFVEQGKESGKSRWFSTGQPLAYELCQSMLRVLLGAMPHVSLSKRALTKREAMLSEYEWIDAEQTTLLSDDAGASWWTFGGGVLNSAIASKLEEQLGRIQYDNLALYFKGERVSERVIESIRLLLEEGIDIAPPISEEVREEYKFGECVPGQLLDSMIALRFSCSDQWNVLRKRRVKVVHEH
jgi:ATP-dependent Lhr-like helicase